MRQHPNPMMPFAHHPLHHRIKPAYPLLLPALFYVVPMVFPDVYLPFLDRRALGEVLQMAFVAVAAGLFIAFPMLIPVRSIAGQLCRWAIIGFFGLIFCRAVVLLNGLWGVISFGYLLYATFGAVRTADPSIFSAGYLMTETFIRWLAALAVMAVLVGLSGIGGDLSRWYQHDRFLATGFLYFFLLSAAEVFLYPRFRRIGSSAP